MKTTEHLSATFDVAIIGGGLAGSALAIRLARAGRRVAVFERDRFPRDKLCGEFLSPESQGLLRELGCLETVMARGAVPIHHARFSSARGRILEFPLPGEGLGISRAVLDEVLFRQAAASGAMTFETSEVKATRESVDDSCRTELDVERRGAGGKLSPALVGAQCVVGAYGRHSRLDKEGGRDFVVQSHPYIAFKKHHRPAADRRGERLRKELAGGVEIHTVQGGYCGLCFVEDDTVNVCMLLRKETVTALPSSRWHHLRTILGRDNSILARRLEALVPTDRPQLAVGHIPFCAKDPACSHVLYIGDAAGMIAPLCGDGQAMALSSAKLLSPLLASLPADFSSAERDQLLRAWEKRWRKNYARRLWLGHCLQRLVLRPRLAHYAFAALAGFPGLARQLIRWTRES